MTRKDPGRILCDSRWICIQMEQHMNRCLSSGGITAVQAQILLYLLEHSDQGTSLTTLHREFRYSMATLSGMLKRLKEKGYIRMERCDGDDRYKLLYVTEKSRKIQDFLKQTTVSVQNQLYGCLSPEELDTLYGLQKKILHHITILTDQRQKEATTS